MIELVVLAALWMASAAFMTFRAARKQPRVLGGMAIIYFILGPLAVVGLVAQVLWRPLERSAEWRGRHGTSTNAGRSDGLPGI